MLFRAAVALAIVSGGATAFAADPSEGAPGTTATTTVTTTTTTQTTTQTPCDPNAACTDATPDYDTVLGIRGSFLHVSGPQDTTTAGAMFALSSSYYKTVEHLFTLRSSAIAGLGGGNGGVEGSLGAALTGGIRIPVTENQGPIARVGLSMELLGNQQFYFSHIDLPLGEVGYQYMNGNTTLEIGGRGAPLLTGRYNTGDSLRRELGTSFEWGGYLAAHSKIGRLDGSFTRIEARSTPPDTPVDVFRGEGCIYVTTTVAICADAMYIHGDEQPTLVPPATPAPVVFSTTASSFYGGLLVGVHW